MNARITKIIGLGVILVAAALLLVNTPVQAEPQAPAPDQLIQEAPALPQAPPVEVVTEPVAPAADPQTFNLCASDGSINLPGGGTVAVWGFVVNGAGCTSGLVTAATFPGPELRVNAGDNVTINLSNALAENVSILIPGQNTTATGGTPGTFTAEATPGATATYEFTAQEGTYLYESGTNPSIQIPMGLYGALIVDNPLTPGQAYGNAFDQEAVLLLSEIDPNLNANPGGFDLLTYHPTYWLINGKGYPDTASIAASPGDQVLLRYLNAGFDHLSMSLLGGAYQRVIAKEGYPLHNSFDVVAETIPAGTTADMIVDTTGVSGSLPLYNRNMYVTNADAYAGGMLTFLNISAPIGTPPTVDIVDPVSGSTVFGDAVAIQIDANDAEDGVGSLTVEWNVNGGAWQPTTWDGSTYYVANVPWDTTTSDDGGYTINARATDSHSNVTTANNNVTVDNQPTVSIVAPADGSTVFGGAVDVEIVADDAKDAAGTLTVEWSVDGGTTWQSTTNVPADSTTYVASWDSTSLSDGGPYTFEARATDSDTLSATDSIGVTVDNQPTVSIVAPADGSTVAGGAVDVEIVADDAKDAAGTLTVEWSVDGGTTWQSTTNVPADSTTYVASWSTTSLSDGPYTFEARATDSDTLSATDSIGVTVDNTAPSVSITAPTDGSTVTGNAVSVEATATDATSGVAQVQFFDGVTSLGTDTNGGDGWSVSWDTTTASDGSHTLTATATDEAGLSTTSASVSVTVDNTVQNPMHIADVSGSLTDTSAGGPGGGTYTADMIITVHDANHDPVSGVNVSGTWTTGAGSSTPITNSCETDVSGQCTVQATHKLNPNNADNYLTFTVDNLTLTSYTYVSADNEGTNNDTINRP